MGVKGEVEKTTGGRNVGKGGVDVDVDVDMEEVGGGEGMGKERGGEGRWIEVSVDMPGQRDDDAMVVFLGEMIHEGLVADQFLQNRLIINDRWHWRLYIDVCYIPPPSYSCLSPYSYEIHTNCVYVRKKDPPPLPAPNLPSPPPLLNNTPRPPIHTPPRSSKRIRER